MLTAPFIWAKLIDLNCSNSHSQVTWREELIHRSGISLLWIKAPRLVFNNPMGPLMNLFINIINQHWGRIQKLAVKIYESYDLDPTPGLLTTAPFSTAPSCIVPRDFRV